MRVWTGHIDYTPAGMAASPLNWVYLFTGNCYLKANGALVMGRGAALQVRDAYPGIDKLLGRLIRQQCPGRVPNDPYRQYGIVWINTSPGHLLDPPPMPLRRAGRAVPEKDMVIRTTPLNRPLGIFQVKYDFRSAADLDLIRWAASKLGYEARHAPDKEFHINYPGVGNGHLTRAAVEPIISPQLPDNVVLHI